MTSSPVGDQRPALRADAERNREAIVGAAAALFGEQGTDAPLDEIARRAGVGIATLYRRFPTRDALVEAVLGERMRHYADRAEDAVELALTQPWEAFSGYLLSVLEEQARDVAFADALRAPLVGSRVFAEDHRRAYNALFTLIDRAVAGGAVRPELDHADVYLAILANEGVTRATRDVAPDAWRRLARTLLDGLRAGADREPLPPVPAVWNPGTDRRIPPLD
jgi:AcrR family transcriptional regulator